VAESSEHPGALNRNRVAASFGIEWRNHQNSNLEDDWERLTKLIILLCPDRSEILNEAFALHSEGRYIACIPLLLSQTDGICAEYLGAFLFSEHDRRAEQIESTLENSEDKTLDLFLSILKNKNQYSKGIGKSSLSHKEKGPNRSGILHGSRKHLDYGTKINSLKCFSLLAFTVFVLVDSMKKNITTGSTRTPQTDET
jgi:hypothetical protein